MGAPKLRIALVQQATVWHDPAANRARAAGFVEEAARGGARVVALTEMFQTGFTMWPDPFAETVPGPTTDWTSELARRLGIHLVATVVERGEPLPYNTAFHVGPQGDLRQVYRKIHPFSFGEENRHYRGGDALGVSDVDGVGLGLQICYDLRFPETFRALAAAGARLVLVPANWPTRRAMHWSTLLAARAIENQFVVCGVNRVGRDPNVEYPGLSAIHDARGEVLAYGQDHEGIVAAEVDFDEVERWREKFPALADRRPEVYARLGA